MSVAYYVKVSAPKVPALTYTTRSRKNGVVTLSANESRASGTSVVKHCRNPRFASKFFIGTGIGTQCVPKTNL